MMRQLLLSVTSLMVFLTIGQQIVAQVSVVPFAIPPEKELSVRELNNLLDEIQIESKDFEKERSLKDFLKVLRNHLGEKGKNIGFIVNAHFFKEENPDYPNVLEAPVRLEQSPKTVSLRKCLEMALSHITTNNGRFIVRRGYVEITTVAQAFPTAGLGIVRPKLYQGTLESVLEELAEATGANIVLDHRQKEKARIEVKARFTNPVSLTTALELIADMADLRCVGYPDMMGGAIYVTSRENAAAWERRLSQFPVPAPGGSDGKPGEPGKGP